MAGDENEKRGCIKKSKGPWIVHRATKDGGIVTRYRFPSDKERQKNKQRERRRRAVAQKIFAGLKEHGNYNLPKHADTNDLLKALCHEAGWHVEDDGTIYRRKIMPSTLMPASTSLQVMMKPSCSNVVEEKDIHIIATDHEQDDEDYCTCNANDQQAASASTNFLSLGQSPECHDHINLKLSLSVSNSLTHHV